MDRCRRRKHHTQERNLPPLTGEFQPRLIQARVKAGEEGIERLTWMLPADFDNDKYDEWLKVEGQDQVDRSIFSAEQRARQLHWLDEMHAAGVYRDDVAYPHLQQMAIEFEMPYDLGMKLDAPAPRVFVSWNVAPPATPRPMIRDVQAIATNPIVQWERADSAR